PSFLLALLPRVQELRARKGRPHWLVLDEAHHLLPSSWVPGTLGLPQALEGVVMITVHPGMIARPVLESVKTLGVVGSAPAAMFGEFCEAVGEPAPAVPEEPLEPGQALLWQRESGGVPVRLRVAPGQTERRRHTRKYAEGQLAPDRSFYFTGPEGKLKLRAQNLFLFAQLAEGIDDDTWLHHLKAGDYSRWFRERIKDDALAAEAEQIERTDGLDAAESRKQIRQAIERYYTLPA